MVIRGSTWLLWYLEDLLSFDLFEWLADFLQDAVVVFVFLLCKSRGLLKVVVIEQAVKVSIPVLRLFFLIVAFCRQLS